MEELIICHPRDGKHKDSIEWTGGEKNLSCKGVASRRPAIPHALCARDGGLQSYCMLAGQRGHSHTNWLLWDSAASYLVC